MPPSGWKKKLMGKRGRNRRSRPALALQETRKPQKKKEEVGGNWKRRIKKGRM